MTQHSIISSLLRAKTYQLVNQPVFDPLLPLPALLTTSNPQLQRTVNKNQRLNHSIPTDNTTPLTNNTTPLTNDTTPLTNNTTPLTDNITPIIVNTAIRIKSA